MCGIAGWVSLRGAMFGGDARAQLGRMQAAIAHRGPDDSGDYWDENGDIEHNAACALGFRRLSIVDLAGGHQPMANEDGQIHIVFNGEIYNHLELRAELIAAGHTFANHSDTEVLIHGWEQWREALFPRLNGMFDLAIWDGNKRELILARDRFGKKPLFVAEFDGGDTLVFGSEMSAVLAHPAVPRKLDVHGLQALLLLDYPASPRTMLQDVATLEPGQWWHWQANGGQPKLTVQTYLPAQTPNAELAKLTEVQAISELETRLLAATERRLMAEVPLGIFLSGGIDSSLVTWAVTKLRAAAEVQTFSIGFEDKRFDESTAAAAYAKWLGTKHRQAILQPQVALDLIPQILQKLDQPLADASILPTYFLCGFARQHVTVALGGDGGDEWWLGYPTFFAHKIAALADRGGLGTLQPLLARLANGLPTAHGYMSLDFKIKRFVSGLAYRGGMRHVTWIGGLPLSQHANLLHPDVRQALQAPPTSRRGPLLRIDEQIDQSWRQLRAQAPDDYSALAALYARFYLADGVLQKVDRASMLHGLEVRAPLLDPAVVELARALPTAYKLRGRTSKWLLRQLAAKHLPAAIVGRPKRGFAVPIGSWLRGPLRPWLEDSLSPQNLRAFGVLDPDAVQLLIRQHVAGTVDHRKILWTLLCLQNWLQRVLA